MEKDIFTLDDMKRLNIITTHYQKIQAPEIVTATLEMKAECRDPHVLRLFFDFQDGRKIITPVFAWQSFLGMYAIPNGTVLRLTYVPGRDGMFILKNAEPVQTASVAFS